MAEIVKGDGKFYIGNDELDPIAEITFKVKDARTIIADHTYVSDTLRGQGIAGKLFEVLMNYAREENLKVVPVCTYVLAKMEKSAVHHDLIAE